MSENLKRKQSLSQQANSILGPVQNMASGTVKQNFDLTRKESREIKNANTEKKKKLQTKSPAEKAQTEKRVAVAKQTVRAQQSAARTSKSDSRSQSKNEDMKLAQSA